MSRISEDRAANPCELYMSWSGSKGQLQYYDKEANDGKGANIEVGLPFVFLTLDVLSCIAGYSDRDESSFYSNEIYDLKKEKLRVRTKKGEWEVDLYDNLRCMRYGAKYAKSIYVAFLTQDKKFVIGNLKLWGSAVSAWIDFEKTGRKETRDSKFVYRDAVQIDRGEQQETNRGERYWPPVFKKRNVSEEANQEAERLTKEIITYIDSWRKHTDDTPTEYRGDTSEERQQQPASEKRDIMKNAEAMSQEMAEDRLNESKAPPVKHGRMAIPPPEDDDLPF